MLLLNCILQLQPLPAISHMLHESQKLVCIVTRECVVATQVSDVDDDNENSDWLTLQQELRVRDADSEDSNAEDYYANSYPDEDSCDTDDDAASHDRGCDYYEQDFGDGAVSRGNWQGDSEDGGAHEGVKSRGNSAAYGVLGGDDDEEYDVSEYEEQQEMMAALAQGSLWRQHLMNSMQ